MRTGGIAVTSLPWDQRRGMYSSKHTHRRSGLHENEEDIVAEGGSIVEAIGGRMYVALETVVGASRMFEQRFIAFVEKREMSAHGSGRRKGLCPLGVCGIDENS